MSTPYEERARQLGVRVIPPLRSSSIPQPNPTLAVCGECGLELKQWMCQTCHNANCPVMKSELMALPRHAPNLRITRGEANPSAQSSSPPGTSPRQASVRRIDIPIRFR